MILYQWRKAANILTFLNNIILVLFYIVKDGVKLNRLSFYKKGLKNGFPIFLGYFAVSFTFGIAAVKAGISPLYAILMSATNFTSAGQFAALSVIVGGGTYIEIALSQLVINLRYSLMSSSLSQRFREDMPIIHRFLIAFGNTDEVFGVCSGYPVANIPAAYCYGVISAALPGWALGTAVGAFLGAVLPTAILSALGIALYGMFIATILPPAKNNKVIMLVIIISMVLSAIFTLAPLLREISSGFRITILTLIIALAAAYFFPIGEEDVDSEG